MWRNHIYITWWNIALLSLRKELVSLQPFHCSLYAEELEQGGCEQLMHWGRGSWLQADSKHWPIFPCFTFVMAAQHWLMTFILPCLYLSEYWLNQPSPTWCSPDMLNYGSNYPSSPLTLAVLAGGDGNCRRAHLEEPDSGRLNENLCQEDKRILTIAFSPASNSSKWFYLVCLEEQKSLLLKRLIVHG